MCPGKCKSNNPEGTAGLRTFVAHIIPDPKGTATVFQYTQQVQVFGFSAATCDFSARVFNSSGKEGSNQLTITGTQQVTLQSGSAATCGEKGTLEGGFVLTRVSDGAGVFVSGPDRG